MHAIAQTAVAGSTQHQNVSAGWKLRTGQILSILTGAFFPFDAVMKLAKPAAVVTATLQLGFPESSIVPIGVLLLICTVLYFVPRTAIFGALLLTGYLGGAVASQVRIGAPLFNVLFPAVFAALAWIALYLRNARLQALWS